MLNILDGVKILDLTRLLPGGYCTLLLADMGAEVLKIEDLGGGDPIRTMEPLVEGGESAYSYALNRNKKSIRLNLKDEKAQQIFKQLVKRYDVLVESFRPGVMDRLNLGYETLRLENPGLIYCSISGYGQDGPYRQRPGHDINYIATAGILGLTGNREGEPVIPAVQIADIGGGGMLAAIGILAALFRRERTGRGQYIDISMLDGVISWLTLYFGYYFTTGRKPERGNEQLNGGQICYNVYKTKDGGYISLGCLEQKFWDEFCRVIGREDLKHKRFSDREEDFAIMKKLFSARTRDEFVALFKEADTCIEPVLDLHEVVNHPQVIHRRLFKEMPSVNGKHFKMVTHPIKFSDTEERDDQMAPVLGQHTDEILTTLGYDEKQIIKLRSCGAVG
ncbi:MAG: CoA transferase [Thermoanaerobacteraceae bacterium]|nr:CoA transferase [Thermoanaerobacteraceae bacterium]